MAIMAIGDRPIKRRRIDDGNNELHARFGLLEHLVGQIARTPPHRCGQLYRRLLLALREEHADPRLQQQLSGLMLQSMEFIITVRPEDDDEADDFDETIIRLAHDITLCLQQVFVFDHESYGDEGGVSVLTTLLRAIQLLKDTSPETVLAIVSHIPVRHFAQLPDTLQRQWVIALVQNRKHQTLQSISSIQLDDMGKLRSYAKVALSALNQETFSKNLVQHKGDESLMEVFFCQCMLLHDPSFSLLSASELRTSLDVPTICPVAMECLVLMSARSEDIGRSDLMDSFLSVLGTEKGDNPLIHRATSGLRNILHDENDYHLALNTMAAANNACNVLESLLVVSATQKTWTTRDTAVWGSEILWSFLSYIVEREEEGDDDDDSIHAPTAAHNTPDAKKGDKKHAAIVSPSDGSPSEKSVDEVNCSSETTSPASLLTAPQLVDIVTRALRIAGSDEYALYLGARTICNDHADWFMALVRDHPQLISALAHVLENNESSDIVRESINQFLTSLLDHQMIAPFAMARQDGLLSALAATDPTLLFTLSRAPENQALIAQTAGIVVAMVRHTRQQQEDNNMEAYREYRNTILELARFL